MNKRYDYIFGFATAFLMLMMLSASPTPQADERDIERIQEQRRLLSEQKDCIEKIQSKQKAIADELSRIKSLLKQKLN
tara:strand:+ start:420 stop:653 length:234 start_codon:yes stop_codon:yes gene_type:complete